MCAWQTESMGVSNPNEPMNVFLTAADAHATDALIEAGFDPARLAADLSPEVRARAIRAASLLGVLGAPVAGEASLGGLIDVTMARVLRAGPTLRVDDGSLENAELHPEDAEALDAYVNAGFRLGKVPSDLRSRAERIDAFGRLITAETPESARLTGSLPASASLIERTMEKVRATPVPARQFEPVSGRGGRGTRFRFSDMVSMAAMFVLAVGLLFPVASAMKSSNKMTACAGNLGDVASALSRYASDFRGELPIATASFTGPAWWNVGESGKSNSANLYTLAKAGYSSLDPLACAGNKSALRGKPESQSQDWASFDQVSYSYHVMFGRERPRWDRADAGVVVLADRSPVVKRAIAGQVIFPQENSASHGGRGQNVLRADGSAAWMASPENGSDNIWLPRIFEDILRIESARHGGRPGVVQIRMQGTELPMDARDSFLGP